MTNAADYLPKHACHNARYWASEYDTPQEAWDACTRPGWLLWYLGEAGADAAILVRLSCGFARDVLCLVPDGDDYPRAAVEAAERWADDPTPANADAVICARAGAGVRPAQTTVERWAINAAWTAAGVAEVAFDAADAPSASLGASTAATYAASASADAAYMDSTYFGGISIPSIQTRQCAAIRAVFPTPPPLEVL